MERGHRRPLRLPGSLAAIALGVLASCHETQAPHAAAVRPRPLVLVAVDGLEWRLVLEMAGAARLPALQSLISDGAFARLRTLAPALSPPIWTSIATGVVPQRHGVLGFVKPGLRDARSRPVPYSNRDRRVKAIWNVASDAGVSACVIGYWATFPVEELAGVMVAQTGAPPAAAGERTRKGGLRAELDGQVHPPELAARVLDLARASGAQVALREKELYGASPQWPAAMQRLIEHSRWSLAADTAYQDIALELAGGGDRCALLIVYLGLPDVLGHRFWRWTFPGDFAAPPPAAEVARFGDVLRRAYQQIDGFVGEIRRRAGANATVIVASDHGMGPWHPRSKVDVTRSEGPLLRTGGHSAARDAFFAAAGPSVARQAARLPARAASIAEAGSILDMTPTLLAMLGLARGADMDGVVMTSLLDPAFVREHPLQEVPSHTPADWQATRRLAGSAELPDPSAGERIEQLRGLGYLQ